MRFVFLTYAVQHHDSLICTRLKISFSRFFSEIRLISVIARMNAVCRIIAQQFGKRGERIHGAEAFFPQRTVLLQGFLFSGNPLCILDPVCGKGTGCFCALQAGMNAIGMDADQKAVREAADYFSKYLQYHSLKHSVRSYDNNTRFLRLSSGDTALCHALCRRSAAHLLVADLPYGIQHAPQFGHRPESFSALLSRVLPAWKKALLPNGVAAVSFNTLTFPTEQVISIVRSSGFTPVEGGVFGSLRHEVEQAVVRDVVFMINKPLEGGT